MGLWRNGGVDGAFPWDSDFDARLVAEVGPGKGKLKLPEKGAFHARLRRLCGHA